MAHAPDTKLKRPHSTADIQALEDELARVAADLRDIRTGMADKGLPELELKSGTFRLYLGHLREFAKTFRAEFERQIIRQKSAQEKDRNRGNTPKTRQIHK